MAQTYFDSQIIMCLTRRAQSWSSSPWGRAVYLGIHIQGTLSNDLDQVTVSFSSSRSWFKKHIGHRWLCLWVGALPLMLFLKIF